MVGGAGDRMDLGSESIDVGADVDCGIQINGTCKDDSHVDSDANLLGLNRGVSTKSDLLSRPTDPPPHTSSKGFGLKKWRRIRRSDHVIKGKELEMEMEQEDNSDLDSIGRVLKRGSANIMNENKNENGRMSFSENERRSSDHPNLINSKNEFVIGANNPSTFNAGADSDNSDNTHSHRSSSKSSTAASTPKYTLRDSASRSKHKLTARNLNNRSHQQAKSQPLAEPCKKPRGWSLDRESSPLSSLDSDSRSSHVSTQNPMSFGGDDASHSLPPPPTQTTPIEKATLAPHSSDQLSSANYGKLPNDCDPLVDSILMLQSAQLALQKEVKKFEEIGKGICSLCDDSDTISGAPVLYKSVDPVLYMGGSSDCLAEFDHAHLSKIVQTLERQFYEAQGSLKEKELRIVELDTTIRNLESPQDCATSAMEHQHKRCLELEAELQDLFKQKLEVEVQSVVLTRTTKDSSVLIENWITLIREQKLVSREQAQSLQMIEGVEPMVEIKQEQAEKLVTLNNGTVDGEEILKVQRGVVTFSKCLSIQLVLLVFVFMLFLFKLGPKSVVVPT